jgi:hypothetical protein
LFSCDALCIFKASNFVYEQFAPGNPSEVLVTSADSRIRILDGSDITHKFKGICIIKAAKVSTCGFFFFFFFFWLIIMGLFVGLQVFEIQAAKLQLLLVKMGNISLVQVKILRFMFGSMKSPEMQGREKTKA